MPRLLPCVIAALSLTACKDSAPSKTDTPAPVAKPTPTPTTPAPAAPTPPPAPTAEAWKEHDLKTVKSDGSPGEWIVDAKVTLPANATLAGESLGRGADDLVEWGVVATIDGTQVMFSEAPLAGAAPKPPTDRKGATIETLKAGWLMVAPFDASTFTVGAAVAAPDGKRVVECTADGVAKDKIELASRICRSLTP